MLIFTDNIYNDADPECDLETLRNLVIANINRHAIWKRVQIAGEPSPEHASWAYKLTEAQQGGGEILSVEASARGITVEELCARVISNANDFKMAEAVIAGTVGKQRDTVAAMKTREELLSYDWRF